jgi:hypothetical protein
MFQEWDLKETEHSDWLLDARTEPKIDQFAAPVLFLSSCQKVPVTSVRFQKVSHVVDPQALDPLLQPPQVRHLRGF